MVNQFCLSFLFLFFGCTNIANNKKALDKSVPYISSNYMNLCFGIETKVDTSNPMELAMDYLNKSDYKACLYVLRRIKGKIDTVYWHSGFYALIVADSNVHSYKGAKINYTNPVNYLSFRYNNFIGDIVNDEQSILFQSAVDANSTDEIYQLQSIEWGTLYDNLRTPDSLGSKEVIESAKKLKDTYPKSKRLDFILAVAYLKIGDEPNAIPLFDYLLSQNYYAWPSLRLLIDYYSKTGRAAELTKYMSLFRKMFPNYCLMPGNNVQGLLKFTASMYRDCIRNGTQRDSIRASILLAQYGLANKDFKLVDSVTSIFFNRPETDFSYDSLKLYEQEIYPEIKMRSLFIRKKYSLIPKYFSSNTDGENRKFEFRDKVKVFYRDYISVDTAAFKTFFEKKFQK